MILASFHTNEGLSLGLRHERGITDLAALAAFTDLPWDFSHPDQFFHAGMQALPQLQALAERAFDLSDLAVPEDSLRLAPCVPSPQKIICVGLNYRGHAAETGTEIPTEPVLFAKFNNSLAASGEPVALPSGLTRYDYEAELVVVIGAHARKVPEDRALEYVLGYCNGNDLSCRDLQFLSLAGQWLIGKTLDGFMPLGPYLVTADEVPEPQNLRIRSFVNGVTRQDSTTADMIFSVAELVSYISRYITLLPGDIISTGTPAGVVLGMKEAEDELPWLKPGDIVTVEVERLGRLVTPLVAETA